ncbi:MAG: gamma-glutamylcyclotransferase [Candidatus Lokiarchaeota archaeon]|nr:gamma-glutamylcyclotransferase [Candidatus Lokiarchaeota archaeon]
MRNNNISDSNFISVVGYGTFITSGLWKNKFNVEVCTVINFTRIFPRNSWFPYALRSTGSFRALKFDVSIDDLNYLDDIEGIKYGLFNRVMVDILLKDFRSSSAFMYIPTEETIASQKLALESDKVDRWEEEIKKIPEIVRIFPELFTC